MTTTLSLSFAALTIDCADPAALADCWGKALGRPVSPGAVAGDTAVDITTPESGPRMLLHNAPEPRATKDSIHPVLITDHYEEEIERLTGLAPRRSTRSTSRRSAGPRSPTRRVTSSTW
jgi:hypothetical protein